MSPTPPPSIRSFSSEDLTSFVRNLQTKTEVMVQILLAIRFSGQITTDWSHVMGMMLKTGNASNSTINKVAEFGLSISSTQVSGVNRPQQASVWLDGAFAEFLKKLDSGEVCASNLSDNFAYNKWAKEQSAGKTFSSSLNSLTNMFDTIKVPASLRPYLQEERSKPLCLPFDAARRAAAMDKIKSGEPLTFQKVRDLHRTLPDTKMTDTEPMHLTDFFLAPSVQMLSASQVDNIIYMASVNKLFPPRMPKLNFMDPEFGLIEEKLSILAAAGQDWSEPFLELLMNLAILPPEWHSKNHAADSWSDFFVVHRFMLAPFYQFLGFKPTVYNDKLKIQFANMVKGVKMSPEEVAECLGTGAPTEAVGAAPHATGGAVLPTPPPGTGVPLPSPTANASISATESTGSMDTTEAAAPAGGASAAATSTEQGDETADEEDEECEKEDRNLFIEEFERLSSNERDVEEGGLTLAELEDLDEEFSMENIPGGPHKVLSSAPLDSNDIGTLFGMLQAHMKRIQEEAAFAAERGAYVRPNRYFFLHVISLFI